MSESGPKQPEGESGDQPEGQPKVDQPEVDQPEGEPKGEQPEISAAKELLEKRRAESEKLIQEHEAREKAKKDANALERAGSEAIRNRVNKPLMPWFFPSIRKRRAEATKTRVESEISGLERELRNKRAEISLRERLNVSAEVKASAEVADLTKDLNVCEKALLVGTGLTDDERAELTVLVEITNDLLQAAEQTLHYAQETRKAGIGQLMEERREAELDYNTALANRKQQVIRLEIQLFWLTDGRWPGYSDPPSTRAALIELATLIMKKKTVEETEIAAIGRYSPQTETPEQPIIEPKPKQPKKPAKVLETDEATGEPQEEPLEVFWGTEETEGTTGEPQEPAGEQAETEEAELDSYVGNDVKVGLRKGEGEGWVYGEIISIKKTDTGKILVKVSYTDKNGTIHPRAIIEYGTIVSLRQFLKPKKETEAGTEKETKKAEVGTEETKEAEAEAGETDPEWEAEKAGLPYQEGAIINVKLKDGKFVKGKVISISKRDDGLIRVAISYGEANTLWTGSYWDIGVWQRAWESQGGDESGTEGDDKNPPTFDL